MQRAARAYGIMDPITWLARMRRFAQPSEVAEPMDLLRAGIVFHARGMINTRAIQNNLDWVWPYWVERQFKPGDPAFIPRAFSLSHINLTHRNWTAVGLPSLPVYPLVDPRGLVTPLYDGWSIDIWVLTADGDVILPSRLPRIDQRLALHDSWSVETRWQESGVEAASDVSVETPTENPVLVLRIAAAAKRPGWLIAAIRPYNPEGIQFVHSLQLEGRDALKVNNKTSIRFQNAPAKVLFSSYARGDVFHHLEDEQGPAKISCPVGMATGAAFFPFASDSGGRLELQVSLAEELASDPLSPVNLPQTWSQSLEPAARLNLPDERLQYLYDAAVRTLLLLSAGQIVPGPFTYRRFWFRDAVMMLHAMLCLNLTERCRTQMDLFFKRQQHNGYFASQEGEWDSNGQVLWFFHRYRQAAPDSFRTQWLDGLVKGAEWIRKKRVLDRNSPHAGLLPAGFSAEHFGPNDYYYWDDFWSIAGLGGAARLVGRYGDKDVAKKISQVAADLSKDTFRSIAGIPQKRSRGAIPASPYRRLDAGAIGSLAADYPLQLLPPGDARIAATVDFIVKRCFYQGGFFQDMIHSGINAYLTLTLAQVMLRGKDARWRDLVETVAQLASDTGQWPEAIHPVTGGGCMGDGHHGWAAAEWVMMLRNCFVREEKDRLVLGSGVFSEWLQPGNKLFFGPTATAFGTVSVEILPRGNHCDVNLDARWHDKAAPITVALPGFQEVETNAAGSIRVQRAQPTGQG